ncbi:MAG: DNA-binding response regulator [Bacteroidetes bacterium]|jgi:two-component system LytT family response regulator|nr:DNA-binding response regulator [Bacteroidota bacterium]
MKEKKSIDKNLTRLTKISLKTHDRIYIINTSEVVRFEAEGSYTNVFLNGGAKIMVSRIIKEFDTILSQKGFLRVHQSHLINIEQIFCFVKAENRLIMKNEAVVPVASRKREAIIKLFEKYVK